MTPDNLDVLLKLLQGGGSVVIVVVVYVMWQSAQTAKAMLTCLQSIDTKLNALSELSRIEGNLDQTLNVRVKP